MSFHEIKQWIIGAVFGVFAVLLVILPFEGPMHLIGTITKEMPTVPDDFVPTVRLVLFTDTHNQNDHVADAIDTSYELFDNAEPYAGVTFQAWAAKVTISDMLKRCKSMCVRKPR